MHRSKKISLRIVATSASELKKDRTHSQHFDEFIQRITSIGLGDVEILPTLARWGFSFWDHCVFGGKWLCELEKKIQTVMFAEDEVEYSDFCQKHGYFKGDEKAWRKWTNRKCDVLALWSHIWYNGDIFVTNDEDFHKQAKKPKLIELGVWKILRPREAVRMLDC